VHGVIHDASTVLGSSGRKSSGMFHEFAHKLDIVDDAWLAAPIGRYF
jgi:hypothetical protein